MKCYSSTLGYFENMYFTIRLWKKNKFNVHIRSIKEKSPIFPKYDFNNLYLKK